MLCLQLFPLPPSGQKKQQCASLMILSKFSMKEKEKHSKPLTCMTRIILSELPVVTYIFVMFLYSPELND